MPLTYEDIRKEMAYYGISDDKIDRYSQWLNTLVGDPKHAAAGAGSGVGSWLHGLNYDINELLNASGAPEAAGNLGNWMFGQHGREAFHGLPRALVDMIPFAFTGGASKLGQLGLTAASSGMMALGAYGQTNSPAAATVAFGTGMAMPAISHATGNLATKMAGGLGLNTKRTVASAFARGGGFNKLLTGENAVAAATRGIDDAVLGKVGATMLHAGGELIGKGARAVNLAGQQAGMFGAMMAQNATINAMVAPEGQKWEAFKSAFTPENMTVTGLSMLPFAIPGVRQAIKTPGSTGHVSVSGKNLPPDPNVPIEARKAGEAYQAWVTRVADSYEKSQTWVRELHKHLHPEFGSPLTTNTDVLKASPFESFTARVGTPIKGTSTPVMTATSPLGAKEPANTFYGSKPQNAVSFSLGPQSRPVEFRSGETAPANTFVDYVPPTASKPIKHTYAEAVIEQFRQKAAAKQAAAKVQQTQKKQAKAKQPKKGAAPAPATMPATTPKAKGKVKTGAKAAPVTPAPTPTPTAPAAPAVTPTPAPTTPAPASAPAATTPVAPAATPAKTSAAPVTPAPVAPVQVPTPATPVAAKPVEPAVVPVEPVAPVAAIEPAKPVEPIVEPVPTQVTTPETPVLAVEPVREPLSEPLREPVSEPDAPVPHEEQMQTRLDVLDDVTHPEHENVVREETGLTPEALVVEGQQLVEAGENFTEAAKETLVGATELAKMGVEEAVEPETSIVPVEARVEPVPEPIADAGTPDKILDPTTYEALQALEALRKEFTTIKNDINGPFEVFRMRHVPKNLNRLPKAILEIYDDWGSPNDKPRPILGLRNTTWAPVHEDARIYLIAPGRPEIVRMRVAGEFAGIGPNLLSPSGDINIPYGAIVISQEYFGGRRFVDVMYNADTGTPKLAKPKSAEPEIIDVEARVEGPGQQPAQLAAPTTEPPASLVAAVDTTGRAPSVPAEPAIEPQAPTVVHVGPAGEPPRADGPDRKRTIWFNEWQTAYTKDRKNTQVQNEEKVFYRAIKQFDGANDDNLTTRAQSYWRNWVKEGKPGGLAELQKRLGAVTAQKNTFSDKVTSSRVVIKSFDKKTGEPVWGSNKAEANFAFTKEQADALRTKLEDADKDKVYRYQVEAKPDGNTHQVTRFLRKELSRAVDSTMDTFTQSTDEILHLAAGANSREEQQVVKAVAQDRELTSPEDFMSKLQEQSDAVAEVEGQSLLAMLADGNDELGYARMYKVIKQLNQGQKREAIAKALVADTDLGFHGTGQALNWLGDPDVVKLMVAYMQKSRGGKFLTIKSDPSQWQEPSFLFVGEKANLPVEAQVSLQLAKKLLFDMHQRGEDFTTPKNKKLLWEKTSWILGEDGYLSYEITKNRPKLKPFAGDQYLHQPLSTVLDMPELFKAYPAADINFEYLPHVKSGANGMFDPNTLTIKLYKRGYNEDPLETILHEVQHWIQDVEGFAAGTSSENVWKHMSNEQKIAILESLYTADKTLIQQWVNSLDSVIQQKIPPEQQSAFARRVFYEAYYNEVGERQARLGAFRDTQLTKSERAKIHPAQVDVGKALVTIFPNDIAYSMLPDAMPTSKMLNSLLRQSGLTHEAHEAEATRLVALADSFSSRMTLGDFRQTVEGSIHENAVGMYLKGKVWLRPVDDANLFMFTLAHELNGHGLWDMHAKGAFDEQASKRLTEYKDTIELMGQDDRRVMLSELQRSLPSKYAKDQQLQKVLNLNVEDAAEVQANMNALISLGLVNKSFTQKVLRYLPKPFADFIVESARMARKMFGAIEGLLWGRSKGVVNGMANDKVHAFLKNYKETMYGILKADKAREQDAALAVKFQMGSDPGAFTSSMADGGSHEHFAKVDSTYAKYLDLKGLFAKDAKGRISWWDKTLLPFTLIGQKWTELRDVTHLGVINDARYNTFENLNFKIYGLERKANTWVADSKSVFMRTAGNIKLLQARDNLVRAAQVQERTVAEALATSDPEMLGYLKDLSPAEKADTLDMIQRFELVQENMTEHIRASRYERLVRTVAKTMMLQDLTMRAQPTLKVAQQHVDNYAKGAFVPTGDAAIDSLIQTAGALYDADHTYYKARPYFVSEQRPGSFRARITFADGSNRFVSGLDSADLTRQIDKLKATQPIAHVQDLTNTQSKWNSQKFVDQLAEREVGVSTSLQKTLVANGMDPAMAAEIAESHNLAGQIMREAASKEVPTRKLERKFKEGREELDMMQQQVMFMQRVGRAMSNGIADAEFNTWLVDPNVRDHVAKDTLKTGWNNYRTPDPTSVHKIRTIEHAYFLSLNFFNMVQDGLQPLLGTLHSNMVSEGGGIVDSYTRIMGALKDKMTGRLTAEERSMLDDFVKTNDSLAAYNDSTNNDVLAAIQARRRMEGKEDATRGQIVGDTLGAAYTRTKGLHKVFTDHGAQVTILAAYRHYRKLGRTHSEAVALANSLEKMSMFSGGKSARSVNLWASDKWKPVSAMVSGLQTFALGTIGTMKNHFERGFLKVDGLTRTEQRNARLALLSQMALMTAAGGIFSLPMANLAAVMLEKLGLKSREKVTEALNGLGKMFGAEEGGLFTQFALHGAGNLMGADISSRQTISGLFGVNEFMEQNPLAVFGPLASIADSLWAGGQEALKGQYGRAAQHVVPQTFKRVLRLWNDDWAFKSATGNMLMEGTLGQKLLYGVTGLRPTELSRAQELARIQAASDKIDSDELRSWQDTQANRLLDGEGLLVQEEVARRAKSESDSPTEAMAIRQAYIEAITKTAMNKSVPNAAYATGGPTERLARAYGVRQATVPQMQQLMQEQQYNAMLNGAPISQRRLRSARMVDLLMEQNPFLSQTEARRMVQDMAR